jgi:hypothetical protein
LFENENRVRANPLARSIVRGVVVWLVLIAAEAAHGIARARWLVLIVGNLRAPQIAVASGSIMLQPRYGWASCCS